MPAANTITSKVKSWVQACKRGRVHSLPAKSEKVREQNWYPLKDLQEVCDEMMLDSRPKKAGVPAGKGRELMLSVEHGLRTRTSR